MWQAVILNVSLIFKRKKNTKVENKLISVGRSLWAVSLWEDRHRAGASWERWWMLFNVKKSDFCDRSRNATFSSLNSSLLLFVSVICFSIFEVKHEWQHYYLQRVEFRRNKEVEGSGVSHTQKKTLNKLPVLSLSLTALTFFNFRKLKTRPRKAERVLRWEMHFMRRQEEM